MNRFFKKLNEPFPEKGSLKDHLTNIIGIGIFISLFLYIFRFSGLDYYNRNNLLMCIHFGLITIAVSVLYELLITYVLKINRSSPSWTFKRWIIYIFVLLSLIGFANFGYFIYLLENVNIGIKHFFLVFLNTLAVGIFPIIFSGLMIQIRANEINQKQAAKLQPHFPKKEIHHQTITLFSKNQTQKFIAPTDNILYLESMQNYVSICYLKNGNLENELLRNTVKGVESQLENTPLIRCHRSFLVNVDLVEKVSGNAQGLRLRLKGLPDFEVPVSRMFIPILRERTAE